MFITHRLLRCVDRETWHCGTPPSLVTSFVTGHGANPQLVPLDATTFGIRHFAGTVTYDASQFLDTNRDTMSDDLVSVFHKTSCTAGFVSHLFSVELRHQASEDRAPRGVQYRLGTTSYLELPSGDSPSSSLCQDLHTR